MTLEELEKRIQVLEDTEEIKSLHREYLFYISNLEMDKALDCFADDIVVEIANYGIKNGKTMPFLPMISSREFNTPRPQRLG